MNLEKFISMVVNIVTRRLVHFGINKGIDLATGKGKPTRGASEKDPVQKKNARETAKRARQAAKITRRLGRF